jgi:hypothetical protein
MKKIAFLLVAVLATQAHSTPVGQDCIDQVADQVANDLGMSNIRVLSKNSYPGMPSLMANYHKFHNNTHYINYYHQSFATIVRLGSFFPSADNGAINNLLNCTPYGKAWLKLLLTHEAMHAAEKCGPHELNGPDCPGVSIALATAEQQCERASEAKSCICSDPQCEPESIDPDFETMDDVEDYLQGLCDSMTDLRDRWNSDPQQGEAVQCVCDGTYSPPAGCPAIPPLPPGVNCSDQPVVPGDDWPIPKCDPCETEGCP